MSSRRLALFVVLALVVGVPLAGRWERLHSAPRCELDGLRLDPLYRVRVVDDAGTDHHFCCVRCARAWLLRQGGRAAAVYVTDEAGGGEVEAAAASFVESPVCTNPVTGNRTHAFRNRADAEEHARTFGGELLTGADRPW